MFKVLVLQKYHGLSEEAKTKLIDKAKTTPANVHDSQVFKDLVDIGDQSVLADSAYHSTEHEDYLLECDAQEFLMRKGQRGTPLSGAEQATNHSKYQRKASLH